jgi:hypothetical protein
MDILHLIDRLSPTAPFSLNLPILLNSLFAFLCISIL